MIQSASSNLNMEMVKGRCAVGASPEVVLRFIIGAQSATLLKYRKVLGVELSILIK